MCVRCVRCGGPWLKRCGECVRRMPCPCLSTGTTTPGTSGGTSAAGSGAWGPRGTHTRPASSACPAQVRALRPCFTDRPWPILIWPVCDSCAAGSGRSGSSAAAAPVVGNVILHDELRFWTDPRRSVHYHQGNTPGTCCVSSPLMTSTQPQQELQITRESPDRTVKSVMLDRHSD